MPKCHNKKTINTVSYVPIEHFRSTYIRQQSSTYRASIGGVMVLIDLSKMEAKTSILLKPYEYQIIAG
jgi:hypothetical protein